MTPQAARQRRHDRARPWAWSVIDVAVAVRAARLPLTTDKKAERVAVGFVDEGERIWLRGIPCATVPVKS